MPPTNVVVDGSNIATEGRSTPSLDQLDQAVRQYLAENPGTNVTVVVDASFGHRIDPAERAAFEEAVAHGELVSPPAGAIGRGDAFLLRIAERVGARVLSNDSFREFHAEHPWLFDEDRLMGGTPVPGVGWIFTPRRPVRGPLTPGSTGNARRGTKGCADQAEKLDQDAAEPDGTARKRRKRATSGPPDKDKSDSEDEVKPKSKKRGSTRAKGSDSSVQAAIAQATEEALGPGERKQKKGKRRDSGGAAPDAVNDPLPFITFASEHPVGSELEGTVVSFTSHGAMAQVEDMLCYVPLAGLGDPPPRRARDVLKQGETKVFQLVALDPARRGAQLALPEVVAVHGQIAEGAEEAASEVRGRRKKASPAPARADAEKPPASDKPLAATKPPARKKAAAKIGASKKAGTAKNQPAKKSASANKTASAKNAQAPKKAAASKKAAPATKASTSKKAVPVKKAPLKKVPAKTAKLATKSLAAAKSGSKK